MREIKIADKPTLDEVKTNTELIKALFDKISMPFGFNVDIPKATDNFTELSNNPSADGNSSAVVIRGEIYTVGSDIAPYNQTSKYTPTTGLWKTLAPCPSGARNSKSVELNGEIYTLGGQGVFADSFIVEAKTVQAETYTVDKDGKLIETKAAEPTATRKIIEIHEEVEHCCNEAEEHDMNYNPPTSWAAASAGEYNLHLRKYNPVTDMWTHLADSPTGSRCISFSAFRGKLYLIGGAEFTIYEYDPATNVWTVEGYLPPINRALWGADLIGNNIYLTYTPLNGLRGSVFRFNCDRRQQWKYMKESDFPITFTSSAVHNNELYIFGAGGLVFGYRKTLKYNPHEERWTELPERPVSAEDSVAVAFNGEFYVFGGQLSPYTQTTKYNPATNTWVTLADAPFGIRFASAGVIGTEIYVVGQWGAFGKYDTETNTWATLTGAPFDLSHTSAFVYNGEMYVFGSGSNPAVKVRKYNPVTNVWTDLADSPTDIFRAKVVRVGTIVYVFGSGRIGFFNHVRSYDLISNSWSTLRNIPELTQFLQGVSATVNDDLFIFEGSTVLKRNYITGNWERMDASNNNPGITTEAVTATSDSVYLFGNNASYTYNTADNEWGIFAKAPFDPRGADAVAIENTMFILGGSTNFQVYYNTSPNIRWGQLPNLPNGHLTDAIAAESDGDLFFIGSENAPHKQFRTFNIKAQTWERLPDCPVDPRNGAMTIIKSDGSPTPPDLNIVQIFIPVGAGNRPGRENQMLYVTLHETDNTSVGANARGHAQYLNTPGTTVSWHYTVDDTETVQHLPEFEDAFHAGDGAGNGNRHSIGIEMCVNSDGNFTQTVKRATELVADICNRRNIPIAHVVQHNYWSGKNCPSRLRSGNPYSWHTFLDNIILDTAGSAIYIISGTKMYGYDFEWRELPDLAAPFQNGSAVVFNGEIYAAGSGTSFRKYKPTTKAWVNLVSCPVDASFSALNAIDGVLYLVGGNIAPHTQLSKYDPTTDTWEALSPCPNSAFKAVTAVIRGDLYVIGNSGILSIYNPRFGLWETRQTRLPNTEGAAAVSVDNSAIIAGGETPLIQYAPSARFVNQIVAEVKEGQRIFYSSASGAAVLRLDGEIIQSGATVAESDGSLVTDVLENSDDAIRGWVQ